MTVLRLSDGMFGLLHFMIQLMKRRDVHGSHAMYCTVYGCTHDDDDEHENTGTKMKYFFCGAKFSKH